MLSVEPRDRSIAVLGLDVIAPSIFVSHATRSCDADHLRPEGGTGTRTGLLTIRRRFTSREVRESTSLPSGSARFRPISFTSEEVPPTPYIS